MLSVINKPFMLSLVLLNVVILSVVVLNVVAPVALPALEFTTFLEKRAIKY